MTKTWTPEQFWEYIEGLTDTGTRDDILEMLTERGLCVVPQRSRDAVIEECAKWHEDKAALETNSLHCGDNSATISSAHRVAAFHRFSARELRALSHTRPDRKCD